MQDNNNPVGSFGGTRDYAHEGKHIPPFSFGCISPGLTPFVIEGLDRNTCSAPLRLYRNRFRDGNPPCASFCSSPGDTRAPLRLLPKGNPHLKQQPRAPGEQSLEGSSRKDSMAASASQFQLSPHDSISQRFPPQESAPDEGGTSPPALAAGAGNRGLCPEPASRWLRTAAEVNEEMDSLQARLLAAVSNGEEVRVSFDRAWERTGPPRYPQHAYNEVP